MIQERNPVIAHSSLSEYQFDGDDADRYYLPARGLAIAPSLYIQGRKPLVVVPHHEQVTRQALFYNETLLEGRKIDLIQTPDENYLMDRDISQNPEILRELYKRNHINNLEIHPYAVTEELMSWALPLVNEGAVIVGDEKKYLDTSWWGHKAGLHRWVDNLDAQSFAELANLPVPNGFVARNKVEIVEACSLIGSHNVILKPYILSGGFDMKVCSSLEDIETYNIPKMPEGIGRLAELMPIVVEELLSIDKDVDGEKAYSMQFSGLKITGRLTRQKVHGTHWTGNIVPSGASEEFEYKSVQIVKRFLEVAKPAGPGGVDIVSVNGEPIVLEVNGGRPTGAQMPMLFAQAFASRAQNICFEKEDNPDVINSSIESVWDRLNTTTYRNARLAFDIESQRGVYPIVWLEGIWSMLIAIGEDSNDSIALLEEAKSAVYGQK